MQHRDLSFPGWISELAEQLKTRPFNETSDVSVAAQWRTVSVMAHLLEKKEVGI